MKFKKFDNFLKRFNFDVNHLCQEEWNNKTIEELYFDLDEKLLTFFIYSEKNSIFEQKCILEEEFLIGDYEKKNIFISKNHNIWNFAFNSNENEAYNDIMDLDNILEDKFIKNNKKQETEKDFKLIKDEDSKNDNIIYKLIENEDLGIESFSEKLVCFKYFKFEDITNCDNIFPIIDDIIVVRCDKSLKDLEQELKLSERYKKYIDKELSNKLSSYKIFFHLEFTSQNPEDINFSDNFYYTKKLNSADKFSSFQNNFLIFAINLIFYENIPEIKFKSLKEGYMMKNAKDLFNHIYLKALYFKNLKNINEDKLKFNLTFSEKMVKTIIYRKIKEKIDLKKIIDDISYYDSKKNFFNLDQFNEIFSSDNIEILKESKENNYNHMMPYHYNSPYSKYGKIFPIISLINSKDFSINYKINVFISPEYKKKKFFLFDINNNFMKKICVALPKFLNKCYEIINYLYDPILKDYYPDNTKEDFYFILQSINNLTALDIFIDRSIDLYRHQKVNTKINYRIQPFSKEDKLEFDDGKKHFITFITKDNSFISYPFIVFMNNSEKFSFLKKLLFDKIRKIDLINSQEIPLNKFKFYICHLRDYFPVRSDLINNSRDEDNICQLFRMKPNNLLVEVPISIENKQLKISSN